jgi:hypothetical protein
MNSVEYMKFNRAISSAPDRATLKQIMELVARIPEGTERTDLANNAATKWFMLPE